MAQFLWHQHHHADHLAERKETVLELSGGTGLPSVLAARLGFKVIFTERPGTNIMTTAHRNAMLNQIEDRFTAIDVEWGRINNSLKSIVENGPKLKYILMSDLLFDERDFEPLLSTLSYLLHANPDAQGICAYQMRDENWNVTMLSLARKWHLYLTQVYCNFSNVKQADIHLLKINLPLLLQFYSEQRKKLSMKRQIKPHLVLHRFVR